LIKITALASSSKGNCYLVNDGSTKILLECGIRFKDIQRGLNFETSDISACLITHEHKDHCVAIKEVLKVGIDCYTSPGTAKGMNVRHHRIHNIKAKQKFTIGTWSIMPFEANHDVLEPLSFLLVNQVGEKLLFATDTFYIKYKFKGLTHIMVEANYSLKILEKKIDDGSLPEVMKTRLMRSHFSLENVKDFLKANDLSKVEEIWLLHLSDTNSDAEQFKREIAEQTGKMIYVPSK